jgi:hypothetical protein
VEILPLASNQSVHVQSSQRSHTARAPSLQSLQLMEALVEEPGEVGLVSGYLSGRLHRVHTKHAIVHVCWRGYSTPSLNDRS